MISSSGYQRVNGLRLWVHRFREASAPPSGLTILLLHGFMDAGATWDMVAPALCRGGHDVVAPDLRGFGQSDYVGPGGYYHFPDYVADVTELVSALAPRRLAVVGHSMGGTVAALYAGANADRVERLALLEGMGPVASEPRLAVDRMQSWLRTLRSVDRVAKPLSSLQEAVERLALHHPRVSREVIESRARLLIRPDETGRLIWAYDPLHRTTAPTPFQVDAFKEFLRRIDCPTLVVSGGVTGWHPGDEEERVACLPQAIRFEIPHAGHMMHWTEPGALGDRLSAFFSEPAPRKGRTRDSHVGTELPLSSRGGMPPSGPVVMADAPRVAQSSPVAAAPPASPSSSGGRPAIPPTYVGPAAPPSGAGTRGPLAPPAGQVPTGPTRPAAGATREGQGNGGDRGAAGG